MTLGNMSFVLKEILWLSSLLWGIILMISAATEGIPYTSIHIMGTFAQDAVGALGFFLAAAGVVLGFSTATMVLAELVVLSLLVMIV
jgi:hypothetical protein